MSDVSICDDVIVSVMTEGQRGADGLSPLTEFLPQKVEWAAKADHFTGAAQKARRLVLLSFF
jgi:hypothetical protein